MTHHSCLPCGLPRLLFFRNLHCTRCFFLTRSKKNDCSSSTFISVFNWSLEKSVLVCPDSHICQTDNEKQHIGGFRLFFSPNCHTPARGLPSSASLGSKAVVISHILHAVPDGRIKKQFTVFTLSSKSHQLES